MTKQIFVSTLVAVFATFTVLTATTMVSFSAFGATNTTTITTVNVSNVAPTLYEIEFTPSPLNLNPGNTTSFNCTGEVTDNNGFSDVTVANATIFHSDYGETGATDNNIRYQNLSCVCKQLGAVAANASCECLYTLQYFAFNGSWTCNMTVADAYGITSARNSSPTTVNSVLAVHSPETLDYGNLSVTERSKYMQVNVSNYGNIPINVSVRAYGNNGLQHHMNPYNTSMTCGTENISLGFQRYTMINATAFDSMTNITNATVQIENLSLSVRTNDANLGNDTNSTYWRLEVPSNVAGTCNGTLEFYAVDNGAT
jgi:hypothetical protein